MKHFFQQDGTLPPHYAIHPVGGLHFAGAERVRTKLLLLQKSKPMNPITTVHTISNVPEVETPRNGQWDVPGANGVHHSNGRRIDVESSGVKSADILVVYCDSLYRMDYTFLQVSFILGTSIKTLTSRMVITSSPKKGSFRKNLPCFTGRTSFLLACCIPLLGKSLPPLLREPACPLFCFGLTDPVSPTISFVACHDLASLSSQRTSLAQFWPVVCPTYGRHVLSYLILVEQLPEPRHLY